MVAPTRRPEQRRSRGVASAGLEAAAAAALDSSGRKGCLRVRAARDLNRARRPLRVPRSVPPSTAPAASCSPARGGPAGGSGIEEAKSGGPRSTTCAEWIHGVVSLPRPRGSARGASQARSIGTSSTAASSQPPAKPGSDVQGFRSSSRRPRRRRRGSSTGSGAIGLAIARPSTRPVQRRRQQPDPTAGSPQSHPRRAHPP